MSYFNPEKYSSSFTESESFETFEKGHKNIKKVDIAKFEELCKKFREKKDLKIKNLTGSDKEDFALVVSYVHLLYGTKYYSHLFDRVRKHFKNVNTVKPGTIGSYFAGCLVETDSSIDSSCSISCAGSMPLPKDEEGWSFCDKAVFLAEKRNDGYKFSTVKPANNDEEMDPAYLFIESSSISDFRGFCKDEKDDLRALGCRKVKMIGYNSDLTYSELYHEPKAIHEIKHRHVYKKNEENESNAWLIIGIILLILLLLIICCFVWYKYYKTN